MKKKPRQKIIIQKVCPDNAAPALPPEDWKKEITDNQKTASGKLDSMKEQIASVSSAAEQINAQLGKGMSDLTDKYGKLIKLYDMMTEYKKQNSLVMLKIAEVYERIEQLRQFCESNFTGETEINADLLKKVNGMERFLKTGLNSFGLVPIFPLHNSEFNPEQQETLATVEPEAETDLPGHVAECINMGIIQNGIVIKYAQVSVYKAKSGPKAETETEENF